MHIGNVVAAWVLDAHDKLVGAAEVLGITWRDLTALTLVAAHEGCSIEWLRPRVGLTQSGTVRLVDKLVMQGRMNRERSNGREVALSLTPSGTKSLDQWSARRDSIAGELLDHIPAAHRDQLLAGLERSVTAAKRTREEADRTCRTCDWEACGSSCPVDRSVASTG